jgi:ABC-type uncharacterized transport system fused permease/ATPase subunit
MPSLSSVLLLGPTACSVVFNFLGRDFFTALSEKNETAFYSQLVKYLGGFALGIPVFVVKSYFQVRVRARCMPFRKVIAGSGRHV